MTAEQILREAVERGAADVFLIPGMVHAYKINGKILRQEGPRLLPEDLSRITRELYHLAGDRSMDRVEKTGDDDFSLSITGLSRFRASVFRQRGSMAAVIRVVNFQLPDPAALGIPRSVIDIAQMNRGLVLVTGPAGSGKSTTLACIIDEINKTREAHVITLEDPIEYLHRHNRSVVTQREIGSDSESYVAALRAALRQSPDVILLGEMRDFETIRTAMTAAETGHLVISTLHTVGAANTIDRVIDAFPPNQQQQIRVQLSMVLRAVVSQQLIPTTDGRETPAFELMWLNSAIRSMIRDSKVHQVDGVIRSGQAEGMVSMDASLLKLYQEGVIRREEALKYSPNPEMLEKRLEKQP